MRFQPKRMLSAVKRAQRRRERTVWLVRKGRGEGRVRSLCR